MARKYITSAREEKAVQYTLRVPNLEDYKNALLAIFNTARDYPESIYKVSNSYNSNDIYVLCPADSEADTKSWLGQYGEVVDVQEDKVAVLVDVSCNYTSSFDEDYVDSEYVFGELD